LFMRQLKRFLGNARINAKRIENVRNYLDQAQTLVDDHQRLNLVIQDTAETMVESTKAIVARDNPQYGKLVGERRQFVQAITETDKTRLQIQKDRIRFISSGDPATDIVYKFDILDQSLERLRIQMQNQVDLYDQQRLSTD